MMMREKIKELRMRQKSNHFSLPSYIKDSLSKLKTKKSKKNPIIIVHKFRQIYHTDFNQERRRDQY